MTIYVTYGYAADPYRASSTRELGPRTRRSLSRSLHVPILEELLLEPGVGGEQLPDVRLRLVDHLLQVHTLTLRLLDLLTRLLDVVLELAHDRRNGLANERSTHRLVARDVLWKVGELGARERSSVDILLTLQDDVFQPLIPLGGLNVFRL